MHIAISGGRGFVGRALAQRLAGKGHGIGILSRASGEDARVTAVDYENDASLFAALQGKDALVNLVGILHARDAATFDAVHHQLPLRLLRQAARAGIRDMLHMSALGASPTAPSAYLQSKAAGERALFAEGRRLGVRVVVMRPSVIFGEDEGFFHIFGKWLKRLPLMPLPCAQAMFQPVAVEDVAAAFDWALESSVDQKAFALGGPETMTLHEALLRICAANGWRRRIVPLPDMLARWQARAGDWLPGAPFTYDNYLSMQIPNITDDNPWPLMGIVPHPVKIPVF
ncbi:MAG: NAD-dependent epimerase/dehydratase family protein [Cardiobacteriaceae bacterium]|nr:NAD-dependent epimerase/dehydratase family protein [Cardiobacteriaceae bacterium]